MASAAAAVIPIIIVIVLVGWLLCTRCWGRWGRNLVFGAEDVEAGAVLHPGGRAGGKPGALLDERPQESRAPAVHVISALSYEAPKHTEAKDSGGSNRKRDSTRGAFGSGIGAMEIIPPAGGSDFSDHFEIQKTLGEGGFGVVYAAKFVRTGKLYAAKCVNRTLLTKPEQHEIVREEAAILRTLVHPNVVKLYSFFESPKAFVMVMELLEGGELFDRIVSKRHYNEKEARDLVRILLNTLKYLHDRNVVHRDLKPENLLLLSKTNDEEIKLCDFGFAKNLNNEPNHVCEGPGSMVGTPYYIAPEILKYQPYGLSVDMWACGVIVYSILSGSAPFHDENQKRMYRAIKAGHYTMDREVWRSVSDDAKDLVRRMLVVDPANRITASGAVAHPWLIQRDKELINHNLDANLRNLRMYNATKKLRAAIRSVMFAGTVDKLLRRPPADFLDTRSR